MTNTTQSEQNTRVCNDGKAIRSVSTICLFRGRYNLEGRLLLSPVFLTNSLPGLLLLLL